MLGIEMQERVPVFRAAFKVVSCAVAILCFLL